MPAKNPHPPKFADRFLQWFCAAEVLETLQGDLYELYQKRREKRGRLLADLLYAGDVVSACRPFAFKRTHTSSNLNDTAMLQHYFKISYRNLLKNKGYSLINIGGLAVGMAVAILIGLWIFDEVSFNRYHQNYESIGQLMVHNGERTTKTNPIPLAAELRASFADDFEHVVMATQPKTYIIASDREKFMEVGSYMDAGGPEMLTLEMVSGSRSALQNQNSVLLSASLAEKLFSHDDPINKVVKIDNELNVVVKGVYADLPVSSEFHNLAFIAPWSLMLSSYDYIRSRENDWRGNFLHVYVQLSQGTSFESVSARIKDLKLCHLTAEEASGKPELFVQPMSKWHLYSKFDNRVPVTSEALQFVRLYGLIGAFVLLLACINFMNLSTARSEKRAKEVGIRKTFGTARRQLIGQFLSESVFTALLAGVLAVLLVVLALPWFNVVAGKAVEVLWAHPAFWLALFSFALLTGVLAGSYPALYLSSFQPVAVLKGAHGSGRLAATPRKLLVVLQFSVSFMLIIGTVVVFRQVQFAKNRPVGYSNNGLLMIPKSSASLGRTEVLKNEMLATGVVSAVSESASKITGEWGSNGGFSWKAKDADVAGIFSTLSVSHDYGQVVGFEVVDGRDFSRGFPGDSSAFLINEAAAKYMGLQHPVGEIITWETDFFDGGNFKVIGVVRDMVMSSPFEPVKPTIFFLQGFKGWIFAKVRPDVSIAEALTKMEGVFANVVPEAPFSYQFADEDYARKFATEERIGKLALVFASLAIFISCLGLFGLASYIAEQRTKEIGIRKVLGASVANLWRLLSLDFIRLVIVSCLIAMPLAYYFMSRWLDDYAYRTDIAWYIFAATGIAGMLIAMGTVSFQAIKAATANPVKSLRTE